MMAAPGDSSPATPTARAEAAQRAARRVMHLILLCGGGVPLLWAWQTYAADPRRSFVVAAVAALGVLLNLVALVRPAFGLRPWLRVLAVLLVGVIAATLALVRHRILTETLPEVLREDPELRHTLKLAAENLLRTVLAVAYLGLTVVALRGGPAQSRNGRP